MTWEPQVDTTLRMHYSQKKEKKRKNRSETTKIDIKLVYKHSMEVAEVDIVQSLIRLTI